MKRIEFKEEVKELIGYAKEQKITQTLDFDFVNKNLCYVTEIVRNDYYFAINRYRFENIKGKIIGTESRRINSGERFF